MYIAVHRSKDALFALSFFLVMAIVIFSTLIYFVERGVWDNNLGTFVTADGEQRRSVALQIYLADRVPRPPGDPSEFESIPSAAWFVLVSESQWEAVSPKSARRLIDHTTSSHHDRRLRRDHPPISPRSSLHRTAPSLWAFAHRSTEFRTGTKLCHRIRCYATSAQRAGE